MTRLLSDVRFTPESGHGELLQYVCFVPKADTTHENGYRRRVGVTNDEEVGMGKTLCTLTFATALLALASSEASAFLYSSFVCQAVGVRSVGWGRSFFIGDAKLIALSRCARRSGICTISYCVPGY
jgi:hypothetical protein